LIIIKSFGTTKVQKKKGIAYAIPLFDAVYLKLEIPL